MKPGWQTTEFWLTVVSTVLLVLKAFGVVGADQADELSGLLNPLVAAVVPIVVYIVSRTIVKAKQALG